MGAARKNSRPLKGMNAVAAEKARDKARRRVKAAKKAAAKLNSAK